MTKKLMLAALLLSLVLLAACGGNAAQDENSAPEVPAENVAADSGSAAELPEPEPTGEPVTQEALEEYAERFVQKEFNGILRFPFTDGSDRAQIAPYLDLLFYDMGETDLTGEELALLDEAGMFMELDEFRLTRTFVIDYLVTWLDMSRENAEQMLMDVNKPFGIYLETTDAWYMCHSDTAWMTYTFERGEYFPDREIVKLYYANPFLTVVESDGDVEFYTDAPMVVTISIEGGEMQILANELLA